MGIKYTVIGFFTYFCTLYGVYSYDWAHFRKRTNRWNRISIVSQWCQLLHVQQFIRSLHVYKIFISVGPYSSESESFKMFRDILYWLGPAALLYPLLHIQFGDYSFGLPSSDYYVVESNERYVVGYQKFMVDLITLVAGPAADSTQIIQDVTDMIELETYMANVSLSSSRKSGRNYTAWRDSI